MHSKMTTNLKLSTTESKKHKNKPNNQNRSIIQIWKSFGGLSVEMGKGENWGKGTGIKKHNWQVQNRQRDFKNSTGNGETKELYAQPMDMN